MNQINTGDLIRIVIAPKGSNKGRAVAATWAGYLNTVVTKPGPVLTVIAQ